MQERRSNTVHCVLLLLIAMLVLARLAGMAILPLMDTTEARYAEIARKMVELGDWVTPWHDYGVPFWGKPPLSFWLTAISFKLFGVNEFAARLPHFLCAVLVCVLVWNLARRRSPRAAALAVAMATGSLLFYVSAGAVMTDGAMLLGTTLAMHGFWLSLHGGCEAARRLHGWLFFVGIALGLLAKGPVAAVLIAAPLLVWTLTSRVRAAVWHGLPWLGGIMLVAALAGPWYLLAELRTPGFIQYFLLGEHWHRFVTPGWSGDLYGNAHRFAPGTIWFFGVVALLPWSVLLPLAAWRWRKEPAGPRNVAGEREWHRYLLLWALMSLLFFSAARNIIWTYVLPALPAVSLLIGEWLARRARPRRVDAWVGAGLALSLLTANAVYADRAGGVDRMTARPLVLAYERQRALGQPLIFVGRRPFSAAFYSHGEAAQVRDVDELWQRLGPSGGFVAVNAGGAAILDGASMQRAARVGQFGAYDLLYVAPQGPGDPAPSRPSPSGVRDAAHSPGASL